MKTQTRTAEKREERKGRRETPTPNLLYGHWRLLRQPSVGDGRGSIVLVEFLLFFHILEGKKKVCNLINFYSVHKCD